MKKKLLGLVPIVLVPILLGLLLPADRVTIEGVGKLSLESHVVLAAQQSVSVQSAGEQYEAPEPIDEPTVEPKLWGYEYTVYSGDKVEVGDKSVTGFEPVLRMNRFGGESWVEVSLAGSIESEVEFELEESKVKTKYKLKYGDFEQEVEAEFYVLAPTSQMELGGFEFEVILKEKPATNEIVLDMKSQELVFYYQPPLTEEYTDGWSDEFQTNITVTETQVRDDKGTVLAERPDNVVGSYAVYHATKGGMNSIHGQDYKAGKAFHIFRPKIIDAEGNWVWGELNYDKQADTLTTIIHQSFLDTAKYPIRHAAGNTFGYTTIGISGTTAVSIDRIYGGPFTCSETGTATSMSAYTKSGASDDGPIDLGLYRVSDGALVDGSLTQTVPTPDAWNQIALPGTPAVTAQDYYLFQWAEETSLPWDAVDNACRLANLGYPDTWPNPHPSLTTLSARYSIYVTYTPAAPPEDFFYFTNDAFAGPPAGKLMDTTANNGTEYDLELSFLNSDRYWFSANVTETLVAGNYTQYVRFDNYQVPDVGPGGEASIAQYSIIPRTIDKDKAFFKFGCTVYNPTGDPISVTYVEFDQVTTTNAIFGTVEQGSGLSYPTSGWSTDGDTASWTGDVEVGAHSAQTFWIGIKNSAKLAQVTVVNTKVTITDEGDFTHNIYTTEGTAGDAGAPNLFVDNDADYTNWEWELASIAGVEDTYTVVLQEDATRKTIETDGILTITVPTGFIFPDDWDVGGTGWSSANKTGQVITVNNTVTLKASEIGYSFKAIPPIYTTDSVYNMFIKFDGDDANGNVVEPRSNVAIEVDGDLVVDNLVFKTNIDRRRPSPAGQGGVVSVSANATVPDPGGKDQPGVWEVTIFNPTASSVNVTSVVFDAVEAGSHFNAVAAPAYPDISGWSEDGNVISWTGTQAVPAYTAVGFYVNVDPLKSGIDTAMDVTVTIDTVEYYDNNYSSYNANANVAFVAITLGGAGTYVVSSSGGEEDTYTVNVAEVGTKGTIADNCALTITVPTGFTSIGAGAQSGWDNIQVSSYTITADLDGAIGISSDRDFIFTATPPVYDTTSLYLVAAHLSGLDGIGTTIDTTLNGAISVAGQTHYYENITSSGNTTVISATTTPITVDCGSGAEIDFSVETGRIVVHLEYVSGGASVDILFNDNDNPDTSRLDTPDIGDGAPDISNAPSSKDFGMVSPDTDYWSDGSAPTWPLDDGECYFTLTNNGDVASITAKATDFTGGDGWTLTSGSPGSGTVRLRVGKSGDANEGAMVILTTSEQPFISGLVTSIKWELKMETGTLTDGAEKTSALTLTATLD